MSKTNKELYEELSALVLEADAALKRAQVFANENKLTFSITPSYGMGGTFYPFGEDIRSDRSEDFRKRYRFDEWFLDEDNEDGFWYPSSHSC